ncbi:fatty acyl-CoA reductase 1-like [Thrips palmi]|uniref:Fatty acyl-CoA reductase n=1 Tax=Thrips palmi TaxID=161013 RepID=A0A6P8Y522_THRPL|nr:fatty acyl-CoA reductase 1-like [Thrips palmi]
MAASEDMGSIKGELAGKHVLVTGGSGFMGKVLLEKLLRSCPDVGCIHVLLRPKKGVAAQDRIQTIINTPLFEPLLKKQPEAAGKLHAVVGDCSQLRLGLSDVDEAMLVDKVSYVFHAAATVRFDDPLKEALLLNTRGTREVVDLCRRMKRLEVLQYVSTTYCFTNEAVLKEQHYPTELDWRTMVRLAETEDKYTLDCLTHKILGFQPNTYTFSKALAENVINDARHDVPVMIFRPAVVISSCKEPFPGWLDNLYGPFGIWAGAMKGVLRFSYGNPNVALSFSPVDWAIRGMIVCAVAKAKKISVLKRQDEDSVDVVNMEGSRYERKTYKDQERQLADLVTYAVNPVRYPSYHIGTSYAYYWLGTVLSELPYGLVIDTLLRLTGQKPRMIAMYRKIFHANAALAYFMHNEFPIETKKCDVLHGFIDPTERPDFGIVLEDKLSCFDYDAEEFPILVIQGAFKYVFKEEAPKAQRVSLLRKLYILEMSFYVMWAVVLYFTFGRYYIGRLFAS